MRSSVPKCFQLLWLCGTVLTGCRSAQSGPRDLPRAEFGLFFGGQIQQRTELPFELDSTRQVQGFRLEFTRPLSVATPVEWTLNFPTARTGPRGPSNAPRAERTFRATLSAGADRFEKAVELLPSDVPGTYNIQVRVAEAIVLDRSFVLVSKTGVVD